MVYLGEKAHLGRCHRILFGEEQLEPENAIYARIREGEPKARLGEKLKRTYSGMDCRLDPGWSHQNISGCPRAEPQRFRAEDLP